MKTSTVLKEEREAKLTTLDDLITVAEGESRELTDDEQKSIDALNAEVAALDEQIQKAEKIEDIKRRAAEMRAPKNAPKRKDDEEALAKRFSITRAIRSQLPSTNSLYVKLEGAEREVYEEGLKEMRGSSYSPEGFCLPGTGTQRWMTAQRAMKVGTTTAGGHTVETAVGETIPFLTPRLPLLSLGADFLGNLMGNLNFPRQDAQGDGAWEGEVDANAEVDPTYDLVQLSPKRYGGYTRVSKQLLMQSSDGVEARIRRNLDNLTGQAWTMAAINGGGSNEPSGILQTAGIGSVTGAAAIDWAKVVALETEVSQDNADFGSLAYLTTPAVRGQAKTEEKASGTAQFIWMDSGSPTLPGEGTMNGYRAVVSTLVPADLGAGSDEHALIFGNFNELILAQWGGFDIVVDPYGRSKNAEVDIVVNMWVDVAVAHPESFAAIQGVNVS